MLFWPALKTSPTVASTLPNQTFTTRSVTANHPETTTKHQAAHRRKSKSSWGCRRKKRNARLFGPCAIFQVVAISPFVSLCVAFSSVFCLIAD
jgi:hypothetical protein